MNRTLILGVACILSAASAVACSSSGAARHEGFDAPQTFDETAILARAKQYHGGGFVPVNGRPFASAMGTKENVRIYASKEIADAYENVLNDPEPLEVGGIIVRELTDAYGNVTRVDVIAQGPAGSNPDVGDLWFAETDKQGNVIGDGTGALSSCASCHQTQASSDFLFGVSAPTLESSPQPLSQNPAAPQAAQETSDAGADAQQPPPSTDAGTDAQTTACDAPLVVNEIQTAGATASDEFVEILNAGECAQPLDGVHLDYYSATGTTAHVYASFAAGSTLAPGARLVIAGSGFTGKSDMTLTNGLADTGARLVLARGTTTLDSVAYGSAGAAGTAAPAPPAGKSISRVPDGHDTNDNAKDFAVTTATPGTTNNAQ
jgi:hypothetical protein